MKTPWAAVEMKQEEATALAIIFTLATTATQKRILRLHRLRVPLAAVD